MSLQPEARDVEVAVISGLSGAGMSEAGKALEDLGWFVIDNLPPALISTMLSLAFAPGTGIERMALVVDSRGGMFFDVMKDALKELRAIPGFRGLVFLDADDDALVRRFDATRRTHPMALEDRVVVGIQRERKLMESLRGGADLVIDTSDLTVRELRRKLSSYFEADSAEGLRTTIISFGYKFGIPIDADLVLDVRFLPNPHWVDGLREQTGLQDPVRDYVLEKDVTGQFLDRTRDLFAVLLPGYANEGRHYLTIAVGCTGGRHRSVVLADELAAFVEEHGYGAKVIHRDVERPTGETAP